MPIPTNLFKREQQEVEKNEKEKGGKGEAAAVTTMGPNHTSICQSSGKSSNLVKCPQRYPGILYMYVYMYCTKFELASSAK